MRGAIADRNQQLAGPGNEPPAIARFGLLPRVVNQLVPTLLSWEDVLGTTSDPRREVITDANELIIEYVTACKRRLFSLIARLIRRRLHALLLRA
jgi:hypothetical protein